MSFEWFISLRYLQAKRRQSFISLITLISVGGVGVGVMALIVVMAVMTGMQEDLKEKILGTNSHIVVLNSVENGIEDYRPLIPKIESEPNVVAAAPFVYSQVMATTDRHVVGIVLRGVDPALDVKVTDMSRFIVDGRLENLTVTDSANGDDSGDTGPALDGIIIGVELAKALGAVPGDEIKIVSPLGRMTPAGMAPKMKKFRVAGTFKSGMYEYDAGLAVISIPAAQRFFNMGDFVTGIEIRVSDIYSADKTAESIAAKLGFPYKARDWGQMNHNLFAALKLEKFALFIILALIVTVAAFNIVSTLIMVVMEKGKEIAILKSMGADSGTIMRIFVLEGLIIGIAGTLLGVACGVAICWVLDNYELIKIPGDVYYLDRLPVQLEWPDVALISLAAILITFLATIYPSLNAARKDPVDALRYE